MNGTYGDVSGKMQARYVRAKAWSIIKCRYTISLSLRTAEKDRLTEKGVAHPLINILYVPLLAGNIFETLFRLMMVER